MKCYGATKYETVSCRYGCCGGPLVNHRNHKQNNKVYAKAARKRARREAKTVIVKDDCGYAD
jgi:iron only hydrogenase large subunit-like protein